RRDVVPRPTLPEAVVVERVVVADDPAVDPADARSLQLGGPVGEQLPRLAIPVVDARIAGPDGDEVAVEAAAVDRAGRKQPGLVGEIPAELLGRGGKRPDLH